MNYVTLQLNIHTIKEYMVFWLLKLSYHNKKYPYIILKYILLKHDY